MERMLVVVFDNENNAFEGKSQLLQLQQEGNIDVFAAAVVVKHADRSVSVKQLDEEGPVGMLTGTAVGSMIGLLGGPLGMAIGALSGMTFGAFYDIDTARVGEDFVNDVSQALTPNRVAIIAEIDEEWTTPVDSRMEALGGVVFRRALWEAREKLYDQDALAMQADLAQLKSEISKANAERRAELQVKLDRLQARIENQRANATARRKAFEARQISKRANLKTKAQAAGRALKDLASTAF